MSDAHDDAASAEAESEAAPTEQPGPGAGVGAGHHQAPTDEGGEASAGRAARERLATVITHFHGHVSAPGSTIGYAAATDRPPDSGTGTLRPEEVTDALTCYVEPEPYESAKRSLATSHVVALTGRPGIGKRTAAISLARQAATDALIVRSPLITLKELADPDRYASGHAYLVIDWQPEPPTTDTDFRMGLVRDTAAAAGAFLIITCTAPAGPGRPQSVDHVAWRRPGLRALVHAYGAGGAAGDAELDEAVTYVPVEAPVSEVVAFARRIADGDDLDAALTVFEAAAQREVRAWFDGAPSAYEVLEATALAFLAGMGERRFEALLARLREAVRPDTDGEEAEPDTLVQRRASRNGDGGLIRVERIDTEFAPRRVPLFKMPGYQRHVLMELWERYPAEFWDTVRTWLDGIVQEAECLPIASALALFAQVDAEELQESYLEPWSRAWPGQMSAVHVLWFMCEAGSAPFALRIAARWAGQGSASQRWTASIAFAGELGRRYPAEATNRIWHLVVQGNEQLGGDACVALGSLYATLVEASRGAGVVLTLLDRRLGDALAGRAKPRIRTRAIRATLAVLSVADRRTRRPSVMIHLRDQPARVEMVARLWAGVLRHRGVRRAALQALMDGLYALEELSTRPADDARALGEALGAALPADERAALMRDFTTMQTQSRRRGDATLARALLSAIEQIHRGGTS